MTETVREAATRLRDAGVAPEALARYVPQHRRLLPIPRKASMQPLGQVWRLGTLLIGADPAAPALYVAGRATRSAVRPYPGNQSISREERRDLAAAALHGGYPEGTAVNFDATPLPIDESTLGSLSPRSCRLASLTGRSACGGGQERPLRERRRSRRILMSELSSSSTRPRGRTSKAKSQRSCRRSESL